MTGTERLRFSLLALLRLGGREISPFRFRVSRTSLQAISLRRPLGWRQSHSRQRTLEICFRPLSQWQLTVVWIGGMSSSVMVLFRMVSGSISIVYQKGLTDASKKWRGVKKIWWPNGERVTFGRIPGLKWKTMGWKPAWKRGSWTIKLPHKSENLLFYQRPASQCVPHALTQNQLITTDNKSQRQTPYCNLWRSEYRLGLSNRYTGGESGGHRKQNRGKAPSNPPGPTPYVSQTHRSKARIPPKLERNPNERRHQENGTQFKTVTTPPRRCLFLIGFTPIRKNQKTLRVLSAFAVQTKEDSVWQSGYRSKLVKQATSPIILHYPYTLLFTMQDVTPDSQIH